MTYSIKVERIGKHGTPQGAAAYFEARSELEAAAIAAARVDAPPTRSQRIATVFSPVGLLVFAYAGRVREAPDPSAPAAHGQRHLCQAVAQCFEHL